MFVLKALDTKKGNNLVRKYLLAKLTDVLFEGVIHILHPYLLLLSTVM